MVQQIILNILAMFKQSSKNWKNRVTVISEHLVQFKCKTMSIVFRALQVTITHATKKRKQTLIISIVAMSAVLNVFFLSTISAQLFVKNNIYSYGSIQIQTQTAGIKVYTDTSCTVEASNLPWGTITPGSSITNVIYIKNEGNTALTLSMGTTDWNPTSATNYIALNWNYNGQTVAPNQVVQVKFTLTVSQSINGIDNFNFQIIINGTS